MLGRRSAYSLRPQPLFHKFPLCIMRHLCLGSEYETVRTAPWGLSRRLFCWLTRLPPCMNLNLRFLRYLKTLSMLTICYIFLLSWP